MSLIFYLKECLNFFTERMSIYKMHQANDTLLPYCFWFVIVLVRMQKSNVNYFVNDLGK